MKTKARFERGGLFCGVCTKLKSKTWLFMRLGLTWYMDPIIPYSRPNQNARVKSARGTTADLIAAIISAAAALIAFGFSLYFFAGFLENDTHLWGVVSAFILCFGVGAFGYVPAGLVVLIAGGAYKNGACRRKLIWAMLMIMPWLALSLILFFISDLSPFYSAPIMIAVILLIIWAVISLWRLKKSG